MLSFEGVRTGRKSSPFDLPGLVDDVVGERLRDGDVLVISSKFIAISEGRVASLDGISPSERARELSKRYDAPPELCELILRESERIIGGVPGFVLSLRDGLLTPNAGIDRSNIEHGRAVLYPKDPLASAREVARIVQSRRGKKIGVVVSDSRLMPTRIGTVGVALAAYGVAGLRDMRGKPDLFGAPLKVTQQAVADDLCTGAQLIMGEADEATPIVLARGLPIALLGDFSYSTKDFAIPMDQCVYMRSLGYNG